MRIAIVLAMIMWGVAQLTMPFTRTVLSFESGWVSGNLWILGAILTAIFWRR